MFRRCLISLLLLFSATAAGEEDILKNYIKEGLVSNLALQQQAFDLQKSLKALEEARGLFLPSLDLIARYSRAQGGRSIEFPVGDIINPMQETLNQLLQEQVFPANIENVSIPFLREEEQETKMRIVQPIFEPKILYNYKIQKNLANSRSAEKDAFARQLVNEIKSAYFNYLRTIQILQLIDRTDELLTENLRVSERLFQNNKETEEVVLRAKVELSELDQNRAIAEKNHVLAAAYFNFLLNRDLDAEIIILSDDVLTFDHSFDLTSAEINALAHREEFVQLYQAIEASGNSIKLANSAYLPRLNFVFDFGFQGTNYAFGKDDDFWQASLLLQWNLFNGFSDRARKQQAQLEKRRLETQYAELEKRIELEVTEAYHNLLVAAKTVLASNDRVKSAAKSFNIINRKYTEGITPQIEFLDARNTLTRSEANLIISRYEYQIRLAEFERSAALYSLENFDKNN